MFDNPDILYSDRPRDLLFDDNWILNLDKIAKLKDYKLFIVNFSSEHYGGGGVMEHLYQAMDQQRINFLLLTHEPSDHQRFDRMLFYPHWYHWSRKNFSTSNVDSFDKTYKWSCLNGNARNHRVYNYFYTHNKPYFNDAYFTFYNSNASRSDDVVLDDQVLQFWNEIKHTLRSWYSFDNEKIQCDAQCNLPANTDSYVHLVTETTVIPKIFVSEKTWKPIVSGQLFLIFGNPGTVSYLRNQGVDVFDDIIDHSYDSTQDWQSRLHQIHQQLELLISQDLKKIYINTHSRRLGNREKFFSGAFDQKYIQTIQQCINTLS